MEQNIEEWANEFITAYYSSVVYSKRDVSKFYDPDNAIIYRDSLKEKAGIKISEALDILVPYIGKGDKLMINQFTSVPIKKGFNLTVLGQTTVNEKTNHFIQFFTIKFFENRAAIISDTLMNINSEEVDQNNLVEIPRPSRAKQNAFHQKPSKSEAPQQQNEINNDDNNTSTNSNTNTNATNNTDNDSNSSLPAQQNNKALKNKKSKNNKFRFTPE